MIAIDSAVLAAVGAHDFTMPGQLHGGTFSMHGTYCYRRRTDRILVGEEPTGVGVYLDGLTQETLSFTARRSRVEWEMGPDGWIVTASTLASEDMAPVSSDP